MNTLYKYAAAFVALLSSIAGLFFYGKSAGKNEENAEANEKAISDIKVKAEVHNEVNNELSDAERVNKLLD